MNIKRLSTLILLALCLGVGATSRVAAWAADEVRAIVIAEGDVSLREGTQVVGKIKDLSVSIDKTQGEWVHVHTSDGQNGWLKQSQVVRLDQAEAYLGDRIRQNRSDWYAFYLRAIARQDLGQVDQALADLDQAIRVRPRDPILYNCRGTARNMKGQYDLALADYNQAISIGPPHAFYYENAARARMGKKEYERAISNYDEASRLDPALASVYQGRAVARAFAKGDPVKVFEDFSKARRLHPDMYDWESDEWWFSDSGDAYDMAFDKMVELPDYRINQFHPQDTDDYALLGEVWFIKGNYSRAEQNYGQAQRLDPDNPDWPRKRGWSRYRQGDYAAAMADYDAALRLDQWGYAYNERGLIRLRQEDLSGAIFDFSQGIQASPNDELTLFNRGWAYYRIGNLPKATADYATARKSCEYDTSEGRPELKFHFGWSNLNKAVDKALALEPLDAYVLSFRGQLWAKQKEDNKALADFDAAERLDPKLALPAFGRAQLHRDRNENVQAISAYDKAIELCPDFVQAYFERGLIREKLKQNAEAAADFGHAIDYGMKTAVAYNARAWHRERAGDKAGAATDYDEAVQLDPKAAFIRNNRGWLRIGQEDYRGALEDFNEALKLVPKSATYLDSRGLAFKKLGQFSEALADFNQALQLDPKFHNAYVNLTWVYAAAATPAFRNGHKAIEFGTKACELTDWKNANDLCNLACAYAEAGNYAEAVKWQTKANEMFTPKEKDQWGFLLELFKSGKPYHEKAE